ncbi:hypothetical protein [Hyphobacterium sp.]|uniref:hypothetical protein n=1 Tax=Hyphobacterium sp. TaxID=2004662 RepID=UPI003BACD26F
MTVDHSYRTHPVRIAVIVCLPLLLSSLIIAIVAHNLDNPAALRLATLVQAVAFLVTGFAAIGGTRSNRWFQSPQDVANFPSLYPKELAARILLAFSILCLIIIGIVFEAYQSSDGSAPEALASVLNDMNATFLLGTAALTWAIVGNAVYASMSAKRALKGDHGRNWHDVFLPQFIITERFEYYQTWMRYHGPERGRNPAPEPGSTD